MLTIGQRMNDFTISAVATQWRAGRPDGAAILGVREEEGGTREYVTAMLGQHEIDRPEPAENWAWGHYFHETAEALDDFTERAGMGTNNQTRPPAPVEAMPTARLLEDGLLLCGHEGCEAAADRLQEAGYTRDWGLDVRHTDGKEEDAGQEVDTSGFVVTAVFHGLEDLSDDGDGEYYLVCRDGHHSGLPFETWNWD